MAVSILLFECTTQTLTKRMEKKLDGNYTRMMRAVLNKSLKAKLHKTATVWPPTSPSRKLSGLDETDMRDTAGKVRTNSSAIYSGGPFHMDKQRQDD